MILYIYIYSPSLFENEYPMEISACAVSGPAIHRTWRSWTVSWVRFRNYGRCLSGRWESMTLWRSLGARSRRIIWQNHINTSFQEHILDKVRYNGCYVVFFDHVCGFLWGSLQLNLRSSTVIMLHAATFESLWFHGKQLELPVSKLSKGIG